MGVEEGEGDKRGRRNGRREGGWGESRHAQGWEMQSEEGIMIEIERWRVADG